MTSYPMLLRRWTSLVAVPSLATATDTVAVSAMPDRIRQRSVVTVWSVVRVQAQRAALAPSTTKPSN